MITVEQMRETLAEISYRPGWSLTVEEDDYEGPYLRIIAPVENSYRDGKLDLGIDSYLSPNDRKDEGSFLLFLIWRLGRLESHESREWLRRDDKALFDPHGDN